MRVGREGPELEHVAEHRDATSLHATEHGERGLDRGGTRVVAVVDDGDTGAAADLHPVRGLLQRPKGHGGLLERNAERVRRAECRERRGDELPAGDRERDRGTIAFVHRGEAKPFETFGADIDGAQLRVLTLAEEDDARTRAGRERSHARAVGVEQRHAVVGQRLDELGLARGDRLDARGPRVVDGDGGDLGDDPDARSHEPAEVRDLAGHVEAELDHGDLVRGFEPEEGERHADLVVEGRGRAQNAVPRAEGRGGGFLRGRLPDIPGDADSRDRMRVAQRFRETPQRVERLRDLDEQRAVGRGDRALDHRRAGASCESVGDELVSVALVAQREEDLTRLHDPRIERAAAEWFVRAWRSLV